MFKKFNKESFLKKLPESISPIAEKILGMKNEEEKEKYLKNLPEEKLKELFKASIYVFLKAEEKSKGFLDKINIGSDIRDFLDKVKSNITENGQKIKRDTVDAAVDALWVGIGITTTIASISLMFLLLVSPLTGVGVMTAFLLINFFDLLSMFSFDMFADRISKKKK